MVDCDDSKVPVEFPTLVIAVQGCRRVGVLDVGSTEVEEEVVVEPFRRLPVN